MYSLHKYILVPLVSLTLFVIPIVSLLAAGGGSDGSGAAEGTLHNPLKSRSIQEFITNIIDILLIFATPIIILFIMYAGYLFVTAQGDTGKVQDAKNALLWAVVGGVIILGAQVIIEVIDGTVKGL